MLRYCEACIDGDLELMGFLGNNRWFRCRCCGWVQPRELDVEQQLETIYEGRPVE